MKRIVQPIIGHLQSRQNLVDVFARRANQLSTLDEKFWTIIGNGSIGEKAEQLRQKTWAIEQAGFAANPRIVLAMGFFQGFRERNGINTALARGASSQELRKLVRQGQFTKKEWEKICDISRRFTGTPIVIRSSAYGDARGTGIYESYFCTNNRDGDRNATTLKEAIKKVLESEFSDDAIAFRKDLNLPNGMAVIIEPVFGQHFQRQSTNDKKTGIRRWIKIAVVHKYYGPLYSGIAYTSTAAGTNYTKMVTGLPTGAVNERSRTHNPLVGTVDASFSKSLGSFGGTGQFLDLSSKTSSCIASNEVDFALSPYHKLEKMGLDWFFIRLKILEELLGMPHYIEWGVIEQDGAPKVAILQIAGVTPKIDFYDFPQSEKLLLKSTYVLGSGVRACSEVVYISNRSQLSRLKRYNKTHKDYILIYPDSLVSVSRNRLRYSTVSNARVLIEVGSHDHTIRPEEHIVGLLGHTEKIFLLPEKAIDWDLLNRFKQPRTKDNLGFVIYKVKSKVTASERQQKAVVELVE